MHTQIFLIYNRKPNTCILKAFAIFIQNIYVCCDIYKQTAESTFTNCLSFENSAAFVCEAFEMPLMRIDSQMHFFQPGIVRANQMFVFFSANHTNASPQPEAVLQNLTTLSPDLMTFQNPLNYQTPLVINLPTSSGLGGCWG